VKVSKELSNSGGYFISVEIGHRGNRSYWTSPPIYGVDNHHYSFEVEYLKGRYPIINTKVKAKQFSSLYKNLWIEVTPYQLGLMQHCIGIGRKKKPYRNHFFTQETDKDWNELVEKGLAAKGTKHPNNDEFIYFWLSKQGLEFVLRKSVSDKVYNEL
jgi:hypothetical protein